MKCVSVAFVVLTLLAFASIAGADDFGTGTNQFTIDFVPISGSTNPTLAQANAGVLDGFGIVNNDYRIGVYEITNDQWDKFEASLDVPVTGHPSIAYDQDVTHTGTNVPTNRVSWHEAAQFVNWLNTSEGHQAAYKFTGTQGTGDYALDIWSDAEAAGGTNFYRHKDAFYFLPTEHEWAKAAYWNGTTLQDYATKDNSYFVEWRPTGGPNSDGQAAGWNFGSAYPDNSYFTDQPWDVTAGYSPEELNGTYDMMGNISEWMESPWNDPSYGAGSSRGWRGGNYGLSSDYLHASYRGLSGPTGENDRVGFRVASIPEPSTFAMLAMGAFGLLMYAWRRRRLILCVAVLTMLVGSGQTTMAAVWEVVQTYQGPIPGDGDWFGSSVTAVGDNVVVGVGYQDILLEDDGAAYLFNGKTGELQQPFHNPDPHAGDAFGASVAPMGNNILIGAPSSVYAPAPTPGVVYLFDPAGTLLQTFNNPYPNPHDGFGASIAATGDTVAISAPNDDTNATTHGNTGAVYLFDAAGSLQHELYGRVTDGGDYFGGSIAAVGNNILVGAGGSDEAAYLFDTSGNLLQTFENPMGAGGGHFGKSVASLGDDVLIDALDGEHAYLFDSETGDLLQTFFNPLPGQTFGHAIAGVGENVFVGAPSATMHLFDASSGDLLYTFDNPGGNIGAPIVIRGNGILTGGAGTAYLFVPIPEPSTVVMLAIGAFGLLAYTWRRRRKQG